MIDTPKPAGQPLAPEERGEPAVPDLTDQQIRLRVTVPPGTRLEVTLDARTPTGQPLPGQTVTLTNPSQALQPSRLQQAWQKRMTLDQAALSTLLIAAALVVYLSVRLIGLERFPIYFFTDEAVQTMTAADLLRDNLKGPTGELLPTYFINGQQYNLSVSVYLQALPLLVFQRSVFLTRLVPVLVGLMAALSVALIARRFFGSPYPWLAPLLLSVTPVWFLHSRTAFETALCSTFFAGFLAAYLLYRLVHPRWLYAALVLAALTFYTYSPGQLVIAVTGLLLFVTDIRYHWQQRRYLARGLALAGVLALPYLRFQINHPGESLHHLQILRSYWTQNLPLTEKLGRFLAEYGRGLNPFYWLLPEQDMMRHTLKGYGSLWQPGAPFLLFGLWVALKRIRSAAYRVTLIALLAAPAGAALVGLGVTRALFMVIPAVLLTTLGLSEAMQEVWRFITRRISADRALKAAFAGLVFLGLSAASFLMLSDSLANGALWYRNYGMGGMQYGARQLFPALREYVHSHPGTRLIVSPDWANGTDVVSRFFNGDNPGYELSSIRGFLAKHQELDAHNAFVLIPEDLKLVQESGKFTDLHIEQILAYPDGEPGFYFVRLRYVDNIDELLAAEQAGRRALQNSVVTLPDGTLLQVAYSTNDMGQIKDLFDGNPGTVFRTEQANPLHLQIDFPAPRSLQAVTIRVGGVPTRVTARLTMPGQPPRELSQEVPEQTAPRDVTLEWGAPALTSRVEIDIQNTRDGEPAHVHAWEVTFR